jgi:hypothetical protein
MRKLIVLSFISLDGVMQAPGGPEEDPTGGFKHGGWVFGYSQADNTIEQKALVFTESGSKDPNWAFSSVVKFVQFQRDRVNRKEITGATVRNYAEH